MLTTFTNVCIVRLWTGKNGFPKSERIKTMKNQTERLWYAISEAKSLRVNNILVLNEIAEKYKIAGIIVNDFNKNEYLAWTSRLVACF